MMLSGGLSAQSHAHDIYHSFTHDARPTWYTNLDTITHNVDLTISTDTFGCEINTGLNIAGFQIDVTELLDTAGGHVITTDLQIYGSPTQFGSYTSLADYHIGSTTDAYNRGTFVAHPGDKVIANYNQDCHSAAGLLGGPNKYRWYKIVFKNFGTGWGSESWRVSLLLHHNDDY